MPDKVLAFYIRLSSEDRDLKTNALKNESNSVFNQRRLLQDYYDTHESLHGYKVIVFCDDGVTGTHFDRPKFDELIEMARNQEIHCIMVKDYCAIIGLNQKDLENQGILASSLLF